MLLRSGSRYQSTSLSHSRSNRRRYSFSNDGRTRVHGQTPLHTTRAASLPISTRVIVHDAKDRIASHKDQLQPVPKAVTIGAVSSRIKIRKVLTKFLPISCARGLLPFCVSVILVCCMGFVYSLGYSEGLNSGMAVLLLSYHVRSCVFIPHRIYKVFAYQETASSYAPIMPGSTISSKPPFVQDRHVDGIVETYDDTLGLHLDHVLVGAIVATLLFDPDSMKYTCDDVLPPSQSSKSNSMFITESNSIMSNSTSDKIDHLNDNTKPKPPPSSRTTFLKLVKIIHPDQAARLGIKRVDANRGTQVLAYCMERLEPKGRLVDI